MGTRVRAAATIRSHQGMASPSSLEASIGRLVRHGQAGASACASHCAASAAPPAPAHHERHRPARTPPPPSAAGKPSSATRAEVEPLALEQVADDLVGPHPLRIGHRGDSSRRRLRRTRRVCAPRWPEHQPAPSDALLHHATGRDPAHRRFRPRAEMPSPANPRAHGT